MLLNVADVILVLVLAVFAVIKQSWLFLKDLVPQVLLLGKEDKHIEHVCSLEVIY
jgi:hypothetical protein